jgi:hypothetical protein
VNAMGFGVMSIMSARVYGAPVGPAARHCLYWPAHDLHPSSRLGGRPMNAEFNWWLLIVGLVVGAALTWLVMSESVRRDIDVTESEQRGEARWIATLVSGAGRPIAPERVEEILRLHREYLAAPPPDEPIEPVDVETPLAIAPEPVPPATVAQDTAAQDVSDRRPINEDG